MDELRGEGETRREDGGERKDLHPPSYIWSQCAAALVRIKNHMGNCIKKLTQPTHSHTALFITCKPIAPIRN